MVTCAHHCIRRAFSAAVGLALVIASTAPAAASSTIIGAENLTDDRAGAAALVAGATGLPYPDVWVRYGAHSSVGGPLEAFVAGQTGDG